MNVLEKIDQALEKEQEGKREYIGASILGIECDRALWYKCYHFLPDHAPRLKRIFRLGHLIEGDVIKLLEMAGFTIYTKKKNGEQYGFKRGPFAGHCDGVLVEEDKTPWVFDVKTCKNSYFNQYKKKGIKQISREYYIQILTYMKYLKCPMGMIIFYNKDTSDMHVEKITADDDLATIYEERALDIYRMTEAPPRKWEDPTFFKCRMCHYRETCHG